MHRTHKAPSAECAQTALRTPAGSTAHQSAPHPRKASPINADSLFDPRHNSATWKQSLQDPGVPSPERSTWPRCVGRHRSARLEQPRHYRYITDSCHGSSGTIPCYAGSSSSALKEKSCLCLPGQCRLGLLKRLVEVKPEIALYDVQQRVDLLGLGRLAPDASKHPQRLVGIQKRQIMPPFQVAINPGGYRKGLIERSIFGISPESR